MSVVQESLNVEPQTEQLTKQYFFGGSSHFSVTLAKDTFQIGENIVISADIDNTHSKFPISWIRVSLAEKLWTTKNTRISSRLVRGTVSRTTKTKRERVVGCSLLTCDLSLPHVVLDFQTTKCQTQGKHRDYEENSKAGEVSRYTYEFPLSWEALRGTSLIRGTMILQQYLLYVQFYVAGPANNPSLSFPIRVLESVLRDDELDFVDLNEKAHAAATSSSGASHLRGSATEEEGEEDDKEEREEQE